MSTEIKKAVEEVEQNLFNPAAGMLPAVNTLLSYSNDEATTVLDPNNPVALVIENAAMFGLASAEHHEKALRRAYPSMATTRGELYHHMTDKDFDVYAKPGNSVMQLVLATEEIKSKSVAIGGGHRKLVIPKDTEFTVGGLTFTMDYPLIIDALDHGGLRLRYDSDYSSPIRTLETNLVDWEEITVPVDGENLDLLRIKIPVLQYKITPYTESMIPGRIFRKEYSFDTRFYLVRVWITTPNGWEEINVTHSTEVLDPFKATAQITVKEQSVEVYIPEVYVRDGLVDGDVRVDVYTTQGNVTADLSTFTSDQFGMSLRDIGGWTDSKFYSPIKIFSLISIDSEATLDGGSNEMSFNELRDRVINNSVGTSTLIVSEEQLENALERRGLALNKHVDYVTERLYHAISTMPTSSMPEVSEPIGAISAYLTSNFTELEKSDAVRSNGQRLTITPDALYVYGNGETRLAENTISQLKLLPPDSLALAVNSARYLFSPYHYVLDDTDTIVDLRAYYLSAPEIYRKVFVEFNETLAMDLTIGSYGIQQTARGYRILITTLSDDLYKEVDDEKVGIQMLFKPSGYSFDFAYLDGTMLGVNDDGERVFEFNIETNLDIDKVDNLIVTNFRLNTTNPTPQAMALDVDLNIIMYVNNVSMGNWKPIEADNILRSQEGDQAVTHEILKLRLGVRPEGQWVNAQTIAGSIEYAVYEEDVILKWGQSVLEKDENNLPILEDDGNGGKRVKILYRKGDPVLDENGDPTIQHPAGRTIRDSQGNPVVANPRGIDHRMELSLLDAKYTFANTDAVKDYLALTIGQIMKDANVEIPAIQKEMLERTKLFVYPKNTIGDIELKFDDSNSMFWPSELEFAVKFYVSEANRRDAELIKTLKRTAREAIYHNLSQPIFTADNVVTYINGKVGGDIEGVVIAPFGPKEQSLILSPIRPTDKATIAKRLIVNPDKSIDIKDDITISFVTR